MYDLIVYSTISYGAAIWGDRTFFQYVSSSQQSSKIFSWEWDEIYTKLSSNGRYGMDEYRIKTIGQYHLFLV